MKIKYKILVLVSLLIAALWVVVYVGVTQVTKVGDELQTVIERDVVLIDSASVIREMQLKKSILFIRDKSSPNIF